MKFLYLFFFLLCLVEIYCQRSRTANTNQDLSTQEPRTVRGRGRTRFTATEEVAQTAERPSSNRRASTRTRIHSNNPKAAADRRARPTEAPKGYAVEEIINESPIDSFRRESKPRVLTASRFDIPTITVPRRQQTFEVYRSSTLAPVTDELPVEEQGFGSTARAILQARGETLLPKTTTPIVDEAYLLNNFGNTIRSIAAVRNEAPIQRATPLRSESPILDQDDIPTRRSSLRGDSIQSIRGSDVSSSRQPTSRGRKNGQAKLAEPRANTRLESQRKTTTEPTPIEEIEPLDAETDAPEPFQGLFDQSEFITETQQSEASGENFSSENEDLGKILDIEDGSQRITEPPAAKKTIANNRKNGVRSRTEDGVEYQSVSVQRTRPPRTRTAQRLEEVNPVSSTRSRATRRRYDDVAAAESRSRGPSVFTAEQYQEVTSRSRTGRRIDSRFESVPERITVDLNPAKPTNTRIASRRITTAAAKLTESSTERNRNSSGGRSRTRSSPEEATLAPTTRPANSRRSNSLEDTAFYGDKTSNTANTIETTGRRKISNIIDFVEPAVATSRRKPSTTPPNRRTVTSRFESGNERSNENVSAKGPLVNNRRGGTSRFDSINNRSNEKNAAKVPAVNRRKEGASRFEFPDSESKNIRSNGRVSIGDTRRETKNRPESPDLRNDIPNSRNSEFPDPEPDNFRSNGRVSIRDSRRETKSRQESSDLRNDIPNSRNSEFPDSEPDNFRSNGRVSIGDSRRETKSRYESPDLRNDISSSRNSGNKETNILEDPISFGDRSVKTRSNIPKVATLVDEPASIANIRTRSRFPEAPPKIDESKLEVLPLFEREVNTLQPARSRGHRSSSSVNNIKQANPKDHMHVSATENDVKFVEKPTTTAFTRVTVTRTESVDTSTSRTRLSTRPVSPVTTTTSTTSTETTRPTSSTSVKTTEIPPVTSTTTKKWVTRSPPIIRESVVAEVNQVTSKTTITRRKKMSKAKAAEVLSRGSKKAEVKLADIGKKKASGEDIDEEDNYPEPFKALIQAKKKQEESRPSQPSSRDSKVSTKSTNIEKVVVTSAASPRSSSTARVVTTELPSTSRRSQSANDIVNDIENELDPKPIITSTTTTAPTRPARLRQLPKFSEKPKYTQKPRDKYTKSVTDKPRFSAEKGATKTTATPRKTYSPKSYSTRDSVEHHSRRKALRSTASPPSTTPMNLINRETKFSAKFIKKDLKNLQDTKGSYSGRKGSEKEDKEDGEKSDKKLDFSLTQTPKPPLPIKKFNSSRYSSRYRGDASQKSTILRSTTSVPFYIPTIPTPAYIPTVPTISPSVTPVDGYRVEKDSDLGLEVISFDDPVNTISSADLVNGEYLTTDKNIRLSSMVKNGTTEKPVSIIERIINSITSISTTEVPNITTTTNSPSSTSTRAIENSAILKLAPKKTTNKDKTIPDAQTNIIETITSEKPTTIIEKIRSSLSALQSNEVGTSEFNSVGSSSTTPLSTVTKYSAKFRGSSIGTELPAPLPLSTSVNPLDGFDEIDKNEVLEKRTIGRLLNILNGMVSTDSPGEAEKLVVVTPKNALNAGANSGFISTTLTSQEPLEAIALNVIESLSGSDDLASSSTISTSTSNVNTETTTSGSTVNIETTTLGSTVNTESSIFTSVVNTEFENLFSETISTVNTEPITALEEMNASTAVPDSANTETSLPGNTEIFISTDSSTQTQSFTTIPSDLSSTATVPSPTITEKSPEISATLPTESPNNSQDSTTIETPVESTTSDTMTTTSDPPASATANGLASTTIHTFPSTLPTIPNINVDSNRMARLLENERSFSSSPPQVNSSTASNTPLSTLVSSTTSSPTTNDPEIMSTDTNLPSTTSMGSTLMSTTTTSDNSGLSTSTPETTTMLPSTLFTSTTSQSTTTSMRTNVVEIMAVPGETRISKAQTSTAEPSTTTTISLSTTQAPTSTIAQSTETIPPTLGEILNGKTVDALTNLISGDLPVTKPSLFETLQVNQNSITSATTEQSSATELPTEGDAPTLSTESTTQFPNSADRLLSSTLISILMPAMTTTPESTTQQITTTSTTQSPTTTTTTMQSTTPEIQTTTEKIEFTSRRYTSTVVPRTSTGYPTFNPSTILPTILTTLFPNLMRGTITTPGSPLSSTRKPVINPEFSNSIGDRLEILSTAGSTARPTVLPQTSTSQRISTTTPPTTTTIQTTTQSTTTTEKPTTTTKPRTTTIKDVTFSSPVPSTKEETDALFDQLKNSGKLKNLNEEQRKNLEEIERIEKEQSELLKQLTLLTTMFGGRAGKAPNLPPLPSTNSPFAGNSNSLANRIISMAVQRNKSGPSSTSPPSTTTKITTTPTTRRPNSIQDQLPVSQTETVTYRTTPSLQDVLKQYNLSGLSTPTPLTSTYGKTDEALLAAILKEQGIGPTTPKVLADKVKEAGFFEENLTTKSPKPKPKPRTTTTARPLGGRLMQGLNWLLDILDPPTTKRPAPRKPKPKTQPTKQSNGDEELLANQPTRITPVVTAAPVTRPDLSQEEIQVLIKQLEAVQEDPDAADQLDFSKIKHLQTLINVNEGVQVTSAGQHGATSRATSRPPKITTTTERDSFLTEINRKPKSSTVSTLSVSNSIDDDIELISTTARTRVLPPVSLNPIPGIDNQGDSLIRGNLLTAAVNVTRAISSFLGSAIQDATHQLRNVFYTGTSALTNVSAGSSVPSISSISSGSNRSS